MAQGPYHYNTTNTSASNYEDDADADYAPRSPNLNPAQFANYGDDPEPLPVHPQHQSFRASVSHISPFSPTGNAEYFGRGLSLQSPYATQNNQRQAYQQQQYHQQVPIQQQQQQQQPYPQVKSEMDEDYAPGATGAKRGRGRGKKVKDEDENIEFSEDYDLSTAAGLGSASNGIEVKTKFPVARIKRIMQADEDVGKVAQVTPVAVSKALELFMISLITKSALQAKQRGSKRVTPQHLKAAISSEEQFDFLTEIVSKVPDAPPPGSSNAKMDAGAGGDSDMEEDAAAASKRKVSSRGRKRRDA